MEKNKKQYHLYYNFKFVIFFFTGTGCSSSGSDEDETTILFSDDFESYSGGYPDWTPAGGWINVSDGEVDGDGHVRIMVDDNPGGMGHFIQHDTGGWVMLINNNYSGKDYTFSIKIGAGSTTGGLGIIARYNDLDSYYYLQISEGNLLEIYKMHGVAYEQVGSTAVISYDTSFTIHTLKMVLKGNRITGYFDDISVTYADDGIASGPVIQDGKIGFGGDAGTLGRYDSALLESN